MAKKMKAIGIAKVTKGIGIGKLKRKGVGIGKPPRRNIGLGKTTKKRTDDSLMEAGLENRRQTAGISGGRKNGKKL